MNRRHYLMNRDKKIAYSRKYRKTHIEQIKKNRKEYGKIYRVNNKEKIALYMKNYRASLPKDYKHKEYLRHSEKYKLRSKNRYLLKKEYIVKKAGEYVKRRKKTDPDFNIALSIRRFQHRIVNYYGIKKFCSSKHILGCSIKDFRSHIEKQFKPGMNWKNHAIKGWHIDHVRPLSSFNLQDRDEYLKACHYTNTQPLWAKDNMKKHAKY